MNPQPLVSILVPIYNAEPYLSRSMASLIDQTLQDIEIICVNDGSTDGSLEIIKRLSKHDKRITVINKKNTGYGDSMDRALKQATGKYIGILEPDDWVEPDAFSKLYQAARQNNADVVKANYYKVHTLKNGEDETFKVCEIAQRETINPRKDRKVFKFAPAIWSGIYRREFLVDNKIDFLTTPGASYQDLSFNFKVWSLAKKAVLLPDAYVHYRIDNENSSINSPEKINCVVEEYAEIETFLCERGIFADLGETMNAAKFRNYHWNFQRLAKQPAKEFYQTWRKELLAAQEEGILNRDYFSKKDWHALRTIIKHPHIAYRILRIRRSFKRLFQ